MFLKLLTVPVVVPKKLPFSRVIVGPALGARREVCSLASTDPDVAKNKKMPVRRVRNCISENSIEVPQTSSSFKS